MIIKLVNDLESEILRDSGYVFNRDQILCLRKVLATYFDTRFVEIGQQAVVSRHELANAKNHVKDVKEHYEKRVFSEIGRKLWEMHQSLGTPFNRWEGHQFHSERFVGQICVAMKYPQMTDYPSSMLVPSDLGISSFNAPDGDK